MTAPPAQALFMFEDEDNPPQRMFEKYDLTEGINEDYMFYLLRVKVTYVSQKEKWASHDAKPGEGSVTLLPADAVATMEAFDLFQGNNLTGRKDFISENGHKYVDFADVS